MRKTAVNAQAGFSLIELIAAMFITLIISGSIYGLLAQGQNAFRREPEISDRQQQIRLAMDLIQRDIGTAGIGMSEWMQVFTPNLNAWGDGAGGTQDALEIFGNDGSCAAVEMCVQPGLSAKLFLAEVIPSCFKLPGPVLLSGGGLSQIRWAVDEPANPSPPCAQGGNGQDAIEAPPGQAPPGYDWNPPPGQVPLPDAPGTMSIIQVVRYEVAQDANGVPNLWRTSTGGLADVPGGPGYQAPGTGLGGWQLVASGIEDLQVEYRDGNGAWTDNPPPVADPPPVVPGDPTAAESAKIVREARVRLLARTTGQQILQGESDVGGVRAIRGELVSVTTPRAALFALSQPNTDPAQQWQ